MNIVGVDVDIKTRLKALQVSLSKETRDAETTTALYNSDVTYVDVSTGDDAPIFLIDSSTNTTAPALVMDAGTVTEALVRLFFLNHKTIPGTMLI